MFEQQYGDHVPQAKLINFHTSFVVNEVLTGLCLAMMFGLIYIAILVFKKVKFKNKIILGMIIFLILDLLANVIYWAYNAHDYKILQENAYKGPCMCEVDSYFFCDFNLKNQTFGFCSSCDDFQQEDDCLSVESNLTERGQQDCLNRCFGPTPDPAWTYTVLAILPVTLFSLAIILNLNNWIFYYFKIGEMASLVDSRAQGLGNIKMIKKFQKILNCITGLLIIVLALFVVYVQYLTAQNDSDVSDFISAFSGSMCILWAVIFFVFGVLTNMRLSKYFTKFYLEHRFMLFSSTAGLTIPLIVRGITDFLQMNASFSDWLDKNKNLFDFSQLVICELLPMSFQLSSLIFGYIRSKRSKRYQLDIDDMNPAYRTHNSDSDRKESSHINDNSLVQSARLSNFDQYFDPPLLSYTGGSKSSNNRSKSFENSPTTPKNDHRRIIDKSLTSEQVAGSPPPIITMNDNTESLLLNKTRQTAMSNSQLFSSIENYAKGQNHQSSKISAGFRIEQRKSVRGDTQYEGDQGEFLREQNSSRSSERHYDYQDDI